MTHSGHTQSRTTRCQSPRGSRVAADRLLACFARLAACYEVTDLDLHGLIILV